MSTVRRSAAVIAGAFIAMLAFAFSAGAAPYTNQATLSVNTQNPAAGGSVTISGQGFGAGESIDITLHTVVISLGTATADASGNFGFSFTLPSGVTGGHTIIAAGRTSGRSASIAITVGQGVGGVGTGSGSGSAGGSGSGGNLASTGVAIIGIAALGAVLLGGGAALLISGRRRRVLG